MTVTNQTFKVIGLGNDSSTSFSFSPMVLPTNSLDLVVTLQNADGTETPLTEGTGDSKYAVVVATFPGTGSVTYPEDAVTPIATGVNLLMKRTLTLEQQTDLENQGGYHADTQEDQFDKFIMIDLQQQEDIDRGIKLLSSDTGVSTTLPAAVALRYLRWDAAATSIEAVALATATAAASSVTPLNTDFTAAAAGSATDFAREDHRHLWGGLSTDTSPQLGAFLDCNGKSVEFEMGANLASVAGDTDIWAGRDGNIIHITGTNAMTDFGTPDHAGQYMWLIFDAACSVTDSATITVQGNANYTAAANDMALVVALTTSTFLLIPFPNNGIQGKGTDGELLTWDSSGNPAKVAAGTSGFQLIAQGAAAPVWAAGGSWTSGSSDLTNGGSDDLTTLIILSSLASTSTEFEFILSVGSTNSANTAFGMQLSNAASYKTSGYVGTAGAIGVASTAFTSSMLFSVDGVADAATIQHASMRLRRLTGNFYGWESLWSSVTSSGQSSNSIGTVEMAGVIDAMKVITTSGTATFDGGTLYWRHR